MLSKNKSAEFNYCCNTWVLEKEKLYKVVKITKH